MRRRFALMLCGALALGHVARADTPPVAREAVGKPVLAAQLLLKQKHPRDALAKLREADAVKDKTPYETYVIAETRAAAEIDAADYAGALVSLEAVLATGVLAPPETLKRTQTLAQLAFQLERYGAVVDYATRYYAQGGGERTPRLLMAQAHDRQGDFAAAAETMRAQLQRDARAGVKPAEDLLLMLASSEYKAQHDAGYRDALTRLVTAHPKKEYWADLLSALARAPGFARPLDLARLRLATDAFDTQEQYTEAAEVALTAGFPADAQAFLDHGFRAGVLGVGPQAARHQRLADMAARQAAEEAQALPRRAHEADSAVAWQRLGETYASHGMDAPAIAALEKSLQNGGLSNPDDATLRLGMVCLRAGQTARATTLLASVRGADGAAELARLWLIRGGLDTKHVAGKETRS